MDYAEKTVSVEDIYQGRVIKVKSQVVEMPNGKKAERDLVMHPGASVVVPLTENGELYMVRQYRKPIEKMSLEVPAGKLDEGEDPLDCAYRELGEETGLKAEKMEFLMEVHSTPGFCNEKLNLYLATGLKEGEAHSDEDEFLSCERIPVRQLVDMIISGEVTDAKTIIGILVADRILKGEWKYQNPLIK